MERGRRRTSAECATLLAAVAAALAASDLLVKALVPTAPYAFHARPLRDVAIAITLTVLLALLVPLLRSRAVAATAGVAIGGAVGNLTSFAIWGSVPNPFVVDVGPDVAFNLADVLALAGVGLLCTAVLGHAYANRPRLRRRLSEL